MEKEINKNSLFFASCIALIGCAMTFAIRAEMLVPLGKQFGLSGKELGTIAGTAFWGFTLAMIIGGLFCDWIGMGKLLLIAFVCHVSGIILTIFASGFWSLFFSTLLVGIGNGSVEAAGNPLIPTLYPENKTAMLNKFHVWFPGGIVIGGLVAYTLTLLNLNWQIQMATILIPVIAYGVLFFGQKFPKTERVTMGISTKDMFKECFTRPLFWFMVFCILLSASIELGTGQWIAGLLGNIGVSAILLLVFINGIMAIGRYFAGHVVHKYAPSGMLLFSAIFSFAGLIWLSYSSGFISFIAAAVFAIGVCYFWPTMYGFVSEYIPKSGALGLSIIGGAGMFSVSLILPFIGQIYDWQSSLPNYQGDAGAITLRYVAILAAILILAFSGLNIIIKKNKKNYAHN